MSWRDDKTAQVRARFKGFDILSRGSAYKDGEPDLFIRGKKPTRPISIPRIR